VDANQRVEYPPRVPISSTVFAPMSLHWRARYWPCRGEIVIGGRPAERDAERAVLRDGLDFRRCVSA